MAAAPYDSMNEGLRKLLSQIAQLKVAPDADMDLLGGLEGMIVQYMQQVANQAAGGGGGAQGVPGGGMGGPSGGGMGGDPMAAMAGMGGAPPTSIAPGGGGGMAGLAVGPPNMDELRRVLSGSGASG